MKKGKDPIEEIDPRFKDDAREKAYKRYKHRRYCHLVIKALLFFVLGVFFSFLLRVLVSNSP